MKDKTFQQKVWSYYDQNKRTMPWRECTDPYYILVSEMMLQQTQVERVRPKFESFIQQFPDIQSLASASFSDVLSMWSGLGYNRRAKFLWRTSQQIVKDHDGRVPRDYQTLTQLPGIGPNTAGAILAYAYNQPVVFIETNVRSVYIHHFFKNRIDVSDKQILELLEKTADFSHPRQWYWALMDYGSHLKRTLPNPSRTSKHHVRQTTFNGSKRQLRGRILKLLISSSTTVPELKKVLQDERLESVLADLQNEGMLVIENQRIKLS